MQYSSRNFKATTTRPPVFVLQRFDLSAVLWENMYDLTYKYENSYSIRLLIYKPFCFELGVHT